MSDACIQAPIWAGAVEARAPEGLRVAVEGEHRPGIEIAGQPLVRADDGAAEDRRAAEEGVDHVVGDQRRDACRPARARTTAPSAARTCGSWRARDPSGAGWRETRSRVITMVRR